MQIDLIKLKHLVSQPTVVEQLAIEHDLFPVLVAKTRSSVFDAVAIAVVPSPRISCENYPCRPEPLLLQNPLWMTSPAAQFGTL
jgi:hypothetical protein